MQVLSQQMLSPEEAEVEVVVTEMQGRSEVKHTDLLRFRQSAGEWKLHIRSVDDVAAIPFWKDGQ